MHNSLYLKYLNNPVEFKDDKLISSVVDFPIMGEHETLIMKESANVVCQTGGSILNVGFGLGIIDSFIRDLEPKQHSIVEVHPGVIKKAVEMGFDKTSTLYLADWRDLIEDWNRSGIMFDGIYFDTINLDWERPEWDDFARVVDSILAPGGVFSFFNNTAVRFSKEIWSILQDLGYEQYAKLISYKEIFDQAKHKEDMKHLLNHDYNLVWYIKK